MWSALRRRLTLTMSLVLVAPLAAAAQSGRISGTLKEESAVPVLGAQVLVPALGLSARSGDGGRYTITGVPAGTYDVRVFTVGYRSASRTGVVVVSGEEARVDITLERADIRLQTVVVSASRHAEKVTDAAASITVIDASVLDARVGNSYALALRNAPGLDVTQVGITSVFVNGRGFNNRFNTRWLTLEDGRVAILAETGLPIGEHTTIPKLDIASMEVVNGPGSALYGANASSGLLAVRTKDPREYPGLSMEFSGGSRSFYDVQARYAGSTGKWGYKLVAEELGADDFRNLIYYPKVTPTGSPLPETIADFRTRVSRASGALVYYLSPDSRLQLNAGISRRDGLGDSNSGHYQIINYRYSDYQLLFTNSRWFAQVYTTQSNSGDTYQLYAAVPAQARNPTFSADSIRKLSHFHVDGRIYAAELQNNFLVGSMLRTQIGAIDNALVTWGGQVRRQRVSSYEKLFYDRITGRPILLDFNGIYGQVESPLSARFRTVLAGRYDMATRYSSQFSPRASLLFTPAGEQTIRLTYGEAYRSPPILTTDVYNVVSPTQRNVGNARGFIVKSPTGTFIRRIDRMVPEVNKTWELGYKAVLASRLFVDVTLWHSTFVDFISGGLLVADPAAAVPTWAYDGGTGELIDNGAGTAVKVQSNYNLGEGIADGLDASVRFYLTDRVALASTISLTSLDTIKTAPTDPRDAGQFNTSSNRMSVSLETSNLPTNVNGTVSARYVNGYQFRSGVVWGRLPSYGALDASLSYRIPGRNTTLTLQAQNIAGCVAGFSTPPVTGLSTTAMATYTKRHRCGLGLKHLEQLNMPELGPMIFLGARMAWR